MAVEADAGEREANFVGMAGGGHGAGDVCEVGEELGQAGKGLEICRSLTDRLLQ